MVSDSLRSPNAIPPRTSSNGLGNGYSLAAKRLSPSASVLKPVPESDWIAQSKKLHTNSMTTGPPGSDPPKDIGNDMIYQNKATWSSEKEKVTSSIFVEARTGADLMQIIFGPYDYMFGHPGKDIRSQLIAAFNAWLKVPEESLTVITKVVGMLHTASLLVDDVEDSSLLRRGVPVAHSIFGTAQTINSANYVYFVALQELQKLKNPRAIDIYTEELINLHRGQGMDLFWRDTLTCPSEDDYLEMQQARLSLILSSGKPPENPKSLIPLSLTYRDYVPLVNLIGLIFQIRDDLLNLSSSLYTQNKGLCEDLTEGKFSFPVIHSIRSDPSNLQLLNILKQRSNDDEVKRYAVTYMERTGSFEYCRKVLRDLMGRARGLVEVVDEGRGEGTGVRSILDLLGVE
ncbi:MAG: geranylgeranyl pyrophosphate synthetase [Candelina submexicana]|nr:MAG: geranylgeranyl pyrophosphate synthetase [Candelina submexicana]